MRNMSFSMTKQQFKDRTKWVTRRLGWWNLRAGEIVRAVEKAQGLKKGEHIVELGKIEIVSTQRTLLCDITSDDVIAEGFPEMNVEQFIQFFMKGHKCEHGRFEPVNRIEFDYL